jgi:hypothetical protein
VVDPFSGKLRLVDVEKEHIEKALKHYNLSDEQYAKFLASTARPFGPRSGLRDITDNKDEN